MNFCEIYSETMYHAFTARQLSISQKSPSPCTRPAKLALALAVRFVHNSIAQSFSCYSCHVTPPFTLCSHLFAFQRPSSKNSFSRPLRHWQANCSGTSCNLFSGFSLDSKNKRESLSLRAGTLPIAPPGLPPRALPTPLHYAICLKKKIKNSLCIARVLNPTHTSTHTHLMIFVVIQTFHF